MARKVTPVIKSSERIGSQQAHDIDLRFFQEHPEATEYTRAYIRGETPIPMPPGTRVVVRRIRIGNVEQRARAFQMPEPGVN
jgi:hypothetical protein